MLTLRDYQREAIDAVFAPGVQRPAVVLPTGSGKTVIFSHMADEWLRSGGHGAAVLILVHRDELVRQTVAKLKAILPSDRTVGVIKAERDERDADVIVASTQTLSRDSRLVALRDVFLGRLLVIVDECHHSTSDSYRRILDYVGAFRPESGTRAVGFTATMMRGDNRGLGDVWEEIVYQRSIKWMIERGHLVDVRGKSIPVDLDLDHVKRSGGDWQASDLAEEMQVQMVPDAVAKAYVEQASDRLGVLFAPTVESAYSFADALNAAGIHTETVHAGTPTEERQLIYKRQAAGEIRVISNCAVLTEGWDSPPVSCAVIARPTSSPGLYIQMAGRVLRPWQPGGKKDALLLDVTGASRKHSLADIGVLTESGKPGNTGQSLLEMELDEARSSGDTEKIMLVRSALVDVDLFAKRSTVWLRTDRNVWFIPAGGSLVFLWDDVANGGVVVAVSDKYGMNAEKRTEPIPLDLAMALGEDLAMDLDSTIAGRQASWRRRREPATEKQVAMLGPQAYDGLTKRDASDLISVMFTSRSLKRFGSTQRTHDA